VHFLAVAAAVEAFAMEEVAREGAAAAGNLHFLVDLRAKCWCAVVV
jgi:hypothetical protein